MKNGQNWEQKKWRYMKPATVDGEPDEEMTNGEIKESATVAPTD